MNLATHAKTPGKAQSNFREALDLWIETVKKRGTFKKALLELRQATRLKTRQMKPDKKSFTTHAQVLKKELKNPRVKESYDYEGFASRNAIKLTLKQKSRKKI